MRTLARIVLVAATAWSLAAAAQDVTLRASVDRASVRENESFTYILRAQGQVRGQPDLTPLATDFRILQTSRNTSIQMAGGQTTAVTEWQLQLMPMGAGDYTLPPIAFSGTVSNPVELEVLPAEAGGAPADIFLEVEIEPETAYAQAQLVFTIRLFRGVSTGRSSLSAPEVSGGEVIVERLGDDREYQVVRDGRNFMALERRFALFPQGAGEFTIEPVTLDAVVITASGFRGMQVFSSEPLTFEVLNPVPPPPQWADAAWLPARSLELTERWSADANRLTAGIPQTRTLILEAEGVQASQLPELDIVPVDGIRQYPDQPEIASEITQSGLQARRTERYAVIAQASGRRVLAAVEMPWFDVTTGEWKSASLPPRDLEILPSPEQPAVPAVGAPSAEPETIVVETPATLWRAISAGLLVVWLATVGLWWQSRRPERPPARQSDDGSAGRAANRRLLRQLRAACQANDARRAHEVLIEWGACQSSGDGPTSLGTVAECMPGELAAAIEGLERSLYGPGTESWDGQALAAALRGLDAVNRSPADDDILLPLYR